MTRESIQVSSDMAPTPGVRVISVDVLRGLTILLMIFVNELGRGAPSWMHHIRPPRADGMTLADVVFPAFLFIVGVSIPLAFERARAAGTSTWARFGHILTRTAGLLFMGVIVYNSEDSQTRSQVLWGVLAFIAIILAWCDVPREQTARRTMLIAAKTIGILGLIALLSLYRREPGTAELPFLGRIEGWAWMRTGWWGILGLIGWAYLTVATLTLLLGRRREWLMDALAILMLLHLAMRHGGLFTRLDDKPWLGAAVQPLELLAGGLERIDRYVSLGDALGSLAAVTMAGCLLGTILRRDSDVVTHRDRLSWATTFTVGLLLAGLVTDTFEGINKIAATPTWCFWSAALTCLTWMLLYRIIDVAGHRGWSILVRPAGANPLVAYFLHPIIGGSLDLVGLGDIVLKYKSSPQGVGGHRRFNRDGGVRLRCHGPARTPGSAGATLRDERLHLRILVRSQWPSGRGGWVSSSNCCSISSDVYPIAFRRPEYLARTTRKFGCSCPVRRRNSIRIWLLCM
jgi:predicted acyltransferase